MKLKNAQPQLIKNESFNKPDAKNNKSPKGTLRTPTVRNLFALAESWVKSRCRCKKVTDVKTVANKTILERSITKNSLLVAI